MAKFQHLATKKDDIAIFHNPVTVVSSEITQSSYAVQMMTMEPSESPSRLGFQITLRRYS
ncbi:hypothetical protein ACFSKK_23135 [Metabacillus endolithicus]|uniref:Uncharacterized protein n=1 Tax=Metabacillus endolithicus TaxID=1535204 RepID=A0ABW5C405_9BACI